MTTEDASPIPAPPPGGDASPLDGAGYGGTGRLFFNLAVAVLLAFIAYVGRGVLIPLIIAGFLCFLIYTLKQNVRRTPLIGKFLPNWLCYLFAFALIIAAFVGIVEIIKSNVETLIDAAPLYEARLREISGDVLVFIQGLGVLPEGLIGSFDELREAAVSLINPALTQLGAVARGFTADFFSMLVIVVTIFLYTVFMLLERRRIFRKIDMLSANSRQRQAVNETIGDIGQLVRQYISVKTVTNLITASVSFLIMTVIGVDFAGFWALLIFLLNFIPIVGAVSAISLPVLLSLVQPDGGGVRMAALALGFLVGAEQIMSSVIEPRLIGKSLNLSPLVILLSLAVWGSLWGFAGMLMAVPVTVTVMIILTQFPSTRPIAILLSDDGNISDIKHPHGKVPTSED